MVTNTWIQPACRLLLFEDRYLNLASARRGCFAVHEFRLVIEKPSGHDWLPVKYRPEGL